MIVHLTDDRAEQPDIRRAEEEICIIHAHACAQAVHYFAYSHSCGMENAFRRISIAWVRISPCSSSRCLQKHHDGCAHVVGIVVFWPIPKRMRKKVFCIKNFLFHALVLLFCILRLDRRYVLRPLPYCRRCSSAGRSMFGSHRGMPLCPLVRRTSRASHCCS